MRRWWYRRLLIIVLLLTSILGGGFQIERMQENVENQEVSSRSSNEEYLIPGGMPIGIYMEMDGVLVLATDCIECVDGNSYEPAKNLVKTGDYIVGMNGEQIHNKKELVQEVNQLESAGVVLTLRRENEYIDVKMNSVEVANRKFKLGIWVKDNIQGLGTLTYLTTDSKFGALGHGIHDSDTEELIEIEGGTVYETTIVGVQKGKKGEPGGLEGVIIYNRYNELGSIEENTDNGIYGTITDIKSLVKEQELMKVCKKDEIKLGDATIRCTVDGAVEEYDIKIKNVDQYTADENKAIIIEIVDKELLKLTGGIVQGMSGSPILKDGKIVGAVTHVLVNDPTRGYGIFIEDMLEM